MATAWAGEFVTAFLFPFLLTFCLFLLPGVSGALAGLCQKSTPTIWFPGADAEPCPELEGIEQRVCSPLGCGVVRLNRGCASSRASPE